MENVPIQIQSSKLMMPDEDDSGKLSSSWHIIIMTRTNGWLSIIRYVFAKKQLLVLMQYLILLRQKPCPMNEFIFGYTKNKNLCKKFVRDTFRLTVQAKNKNIKYALLIIYSY